MQVTRRERLKRKAQRYREWAEARRRKAEAAREAARQIADAIPLGQPILVGHHSERRHRRDLSRYLQLEEAAIDHERMAQKHERKAEAIEAQLDRAIFSDDEGAAGSLQKRIADLEAERSWTRSRTQQSTAIRFGGGN